MQTNIEITSYHPHLDVDYLNTVYGDDWEYAADMFVTFRDHILPEFEKLLPYLAAENWEQYFKTAHKVKTSLLMVGMTELQKKIAEVEVLAKTAPVQSELELKTKVILEDLKKIVPVLHQQITFLESPERTS